MVQTLQPVLKAAAYGNPSFTALMGCLIAPARCQWLPPRVLCAYRLNTGCLAPVPRLPLQATRKSMRVSANNARLWVSWWGNEQNHQMWRKP